MAASKLSWAIPGQNSPWILRGWRNVWIGVALALLALTFVPGVAHAQEGTARHKLWSKLGHSHWIAQGSGTRILYVIFDPNCPYCHVLIDELQSQIQPLHLQVRYILVGFLAPSSSGKAAYILQAKDPLAAILENEKKFNMAHFGGVPETLGDEKTDKILEGNLALLNKAGKQLVPTMIYREEDGSLQIVQGALNSSNLRDALKEIPLHPKALPGK
ncbi:thioredoxin fold domain-containing protein [Acidithiobacillus sp. IBUN Pt1247-S3]|uniref:thioredoxin fold domain-containing protein n=1 Tax=Acidithiobacillus sp. IBUN Pt1247-S3 TaxID=3166642 RepID=UPI0034E474E5